MSEETNANVSETPAEPKPKGRGSRLKPIIFLIIFIGLIVVAGYFLSNSSKAFATVNGEKISLAEYNERYQRIVSSLESRGQSATSTEIMTVIKKQVTDDLIAETLLLQEATKKGIVAKTDEVDKVFEQNKSSFPNADEFKKELTNQGFSESTFKEILTTQNIVQQYLTSVIDLASVTATADEISTVYKQATASAEPGSKVPVFKDVETQIKNQIIQQKQQDLVVKYIETLKSKSQIQVAIQ